MYGASQDTIELIEKAIAKHQHGDAATAEQLYMDAQKEGHPYAKYCYFVYLRREKRLSEAEKIFDELLNQKFPPAVVRKGVEEFNKKILKPQS